MSARRRFAWIRRHPGPDEGFAYLTLGTAHVMLEQRGIGRNWVAASVEPPFGRGANFQVSVPELDPILTALADGD